MVPTTNSEGRLKDVNAYTMSVAFRDHTNETLSSLLILGKIWSNWKLRDSVLCRSGV